MHHPSVNRKEYSYVKGVYTNGIEGCRAGRLFYFGQHGFRSA
jgi:hypothetical protein